MVVVASRRWGRPGAHSTHLSTGCLIQAAGNQAWLTSISRLPGSNTRTGSTAGGGSASVQQRKMLSSAECRRFKLITIIVTAFFKMLCLSLPRHRATTVADGWGWTSETWSSISSRQGEPGSGFSVPKDAIMQPKMRALGFGAERKLPAQL